MTNATLTASAASVRPFVWGDPTTGFNYTSVVQPSYGKFKETIYTSFQAYLTDTAAGATATVLIQATNDALTGAGVTIPVALTNASANITIPTGPITVNVLDGTNNPTGQRTIQSPPYQSFYAVPWQSGMSVFPSSSIYRGQPTTEGLFPGSGGTQQNTIPLAVGMAITGGVPTAGFAVGTTISSFTNAFTMVASNTWGGATGNYFLTFASTNWCATPVGTITLTATGVLSISDGFSTAANWKFVRANVTALTGTAPQIMVFLGA